MLYFRKQHTIILQWPKIKYIIYAGAARGFADDKLVQAAQAQFIAYSPRRPSAGGGWAWTNRRGTCAQRPRSWLVGGLPVVTALGLRHEGSVASSSLGQKSFQVTALQARSRQQQGREPLPATAAVSRLPCALLAVAPQAPPTQIADPRGAPAPVARPPHCSCLLAPSCVTVAGTRNLAQARLASRAPGATCAGLCMGWRQEPGAGSYTMRSIPA